jgi:GNAT superfamily N-acetyltransferase
MENPLIYQEEPEKHYPGLVGVLAAGTGVFRPDEIQVARELVEERLARGAASGYHFWFALDQGCLAGYTCFGEIPCTQGSFDLYWIVVAKDRQGRGLGAALLEKTEAAVDDRGGRAIYVETSGRPDYRSTRSFYRHCGYQMAAVFPDFYAPGDAKVVFKKTLAGV